MKNNAERDSASQDLNVQKTALVSLGAGCLTFVVASLALGGGVLLDMRLGTFPRWTLILLGASAPFTLAGVYLIVRRVLRRSKGEEESCHDGPHQYDAFR